MNRSTLLHLTSIAGLLIGCGPEGPASIAGETSRSTSTDAGSEESADTLADAESEDTGETTGGTDWEGDCSERVSAVAFETTLGGESIVYGLLSDECVAIAVNPELGELALDCPELGEFHFEAEASDGSTVLPPSLELGASYHLWWSEETSITGCRSGRRVLHDDAGVVLAAIDSDSPCYGSIDQEIDAAGLDFDTTRDDCESVSADPRSCAPEAPMGFEVRSDIGEELTLPPDERDGTISSSFGSYRVRIADAWHRDCELLHSTSEHVELLYVRE